jgi:transposase-like protein
MEQQLRALRRRIERASRNARGYRRYDEELRVEIVEYVRRRRDDGYCQAEGARELGLTQRTIWGWVRQAQHDVMRPVEIIDDEPVTTSGGRGAGPAGRLEESRASVRADLCGDRGQGRERQDG